MRRNPPLIVAGMHRSGTSLTASLVAAAGVAVGEHLLAADKANPLGYFEDVDFVAFHGRMLAEQTPEGDGGHRDWGWTESERLDRQRFPDYRDEARPLIETRLAAGRPWGWKDPRTTLALDFWAGVLEDAGLREDTRFLLVYRYPWDVADSMQRLGADVFLLHPEYAYRIWAYYNRHLLDFRRRHRERCLLVSANALVRRPERFRELLAARLELDLPEERLRGIVEAHRMRTTEGTDPLIGLVAATSPETVRLLSELDDDADLPGTGLWAAPRVEDHKALPVTGSAPVRLSVVIPCLDHGELLVEAVASAERAISEPYELIVVDDGSRQPRTLEVLARLKSAGYFVLRQENAGLSAARNRGIELATGRYILPLDSDNRLLPGFPETAMRVLDETPEVGVVYGDRCDFGLRSGVVHVPDFDLDTLLRGNFIDACAVLRRQVWAECGGFDDAMPFPGWEDWELWITAAERGWRFHRLAEVTFEYRVRPDAMSWVCLREEVGRPLQDYIVDKHRDLYGERLPQLLIAAQSAERSLGRLREEVDRLRLDVDSLTGEREALARERDVLTSQLQALDTERSALSSRLQALDAERSTLAAERDVLTAERDVLTAERDVLTTERDVLTTGCADLATERDRLLAEQERWQGERDRLYQELASWRERVAAMEKTTAWRLRERLVRLRRG